MLFPRGDEVLDASHVETINGPTVGLSDYSATGIPVPAGVGPTSRTISLTR
jgi:hypothetical protein